MSTGSSESRVRRLAKASLRALQRALGTNGDKVAECRRGGLLDADETRVRAGRKRSSARHFTGGRGTMDAKIDSGELEQETSTDESGLSTEGALALAPVA